MTEVMDTAPVLWLLGVLIGGYVVFVVGALLFGRRIRQYRDRQSRRAKPGWEWACWLQSCSFHSTNGVMADAHEQVRGHTVHLVKCPVREQVR